MPAHKKEAAGSSETSVVFTLSKLYAPRTRTNIGKLVTYLLSDLAAAGSQLVSKMPITVAAQSKARNIFARSNTEVVGLNPT
jgi:hypothetical protein